MHLSNPLDLKLIRVVRRYVSTGKGEARRYWKLKSMGYMLLADRDLVRFGKSLAADARRISDEELELLLGFEWRARLTAAWLIGLDRRTQFREQLSRMLLESELVYAGGGYCLALARFAEEPDAEILVAYLDRYLPRLDCHYDQDDAIGALLYLDERLGTDHASRFLRPGGLWESSTMSKVDPSYRKVLTQEMCVFADACMAGAVDHWLSHRRRFMEQMGHPM